MRAEVEEICLALGLSSFFLPSRALADAPLLTGEPRDLFPIPVALVRAHSVHLWSDLHGSAALAAAWWTATCFRVTSFSPVQPELTSSLACVSKGSLPSPSTRHERGPKQQAESGGVEDGQTKGREAERTSGEPAQVECRARHGAAWLAKEHGVVLAIADVQ